MFSADAREDQQARRSSQPKRRIITAIASGCANAFTRAGPDALSDYELLEMALFPALPRRDTKPLAKSLLKTFGSFAEVIHAPDRAACARSTASATPRSTSSS